MNMTMSMSIPSRKIFWEIRDLLVCVVIVNFSSTYFGIYHLLSAFAGLLELTFDCRPSLLLANSFCPGLLLKLSVYLVAYLVKRIKVGDVIAILVGFESMTANTEKLKTFKTDTLYNIFQYLILSSLESIKLAISVYVVDVE